MAKLMKKYRCKMCNKEFSVNPNSLFPYKDALTGKEVNKVVCPYCNSMNVYDTGVFI
jgi:transposase-like protein